MARSSAGRVGVWFKHDIHLKRVWFPHVIVDILEWPVRRVAHLAHGIAVIPRRRYGPRVRYVGPRVIINKNLSIPALAVPRCSQASRVLTIGQLTVIPLCHPEAESSRALDCGFENDSCGLARVGIAELRVCPNDFSLTDPRRIKVGRKRDGRIFDVESLAGFAIVSARLERDRNLSALADVGPVKADRASLKLRRSQIDSMTLGFGLDEMVEDDAGQRPLHVSDLVVRNTVADDL